MPSFVALLGIVVVLFASTNIDDLFVLLGFFSDPRYRAAQIVIGQYAGITALYGFSVLASMLSLVVPPPIIGLLGLAPIVIGLMKLYSLRRGTDLDAAAQGGEAMVSMRAGGNILTVAIATLANGGDNLSIYTPLFATRSAVEIAAIGLVFALMTALWCVVGHWLVHHPALGAPIRRYGQRAVPFILIGLGALILYRAGTLNLL